MTLRELLGMRGFDLSARTKVVRHQSPNFDVRQLRRDGWLETYQQYSSRGTFERCDFVVSFITEPDGSVRFFGVFRVLGFSPSEANPTPEGFPIPQAAGWGVYFDLQRVAGYEDFEGRVVIDWKHRVWHRWMDGGNDWEVVQVLPRGYVRPFPGYLEVLLSFDELREIIDHPSANQEWHRMLAVPGVYLITDRLTGQQYVGSATGGRGIIGRWAAYRVNGHGGNRRLMLLVNGDPEHARHFQFSVLRTLPPELHRQEAIRQEHLYKEKLGSRAHGLNEN